VAVADMQAQMGERKWTSVAANAQDKALAVHFMATQPFHRDMDAPAATSGTCGKNFGTSALQPDHIPNRLGSG